MGKLSEKDIVELTNNTRLQSSDLMKLFILLGLQQNEIEKAKKNADTTDVTLQAASVLQYWRKSRGIDATRQVIITALKKCGYIEAVEILQEKWTMTSNEKGSSISSCS